MPALVRRVVRRRRRRRSAGRARANRDQARAARRARRQRVGLAWDVTYCARFFSLGRILNRAPTAFATPSKPGGLAVGWPFYASRTKSQPRRPSTTPGFSHSPRFLKERMMHAMLLSAAPGLMLSPNAASGALRMGQPAMQIASPAGIASANAGMAGGVMPVQGDSAILVQGGSLRTWCTAGGRAGPGRPRPRAVRSMPTSVRHASTTRRARCVCTRERPAPPVQRGH